MINRVVFKANDLRGVVAAKGVPGEWDEAGAAHVGQAFAEVAGLAGQRIVVGRDMRVSGEAMSAAFIAGARSRGVSVLDSGLSSTDQLWYASGSLDLHGVQFTASHNPASYNGIKFCRPGAAPVDGDFLTRVAERALELDAAVPPVGEPVDGATLETIDTLPGYVETLHSLVGTTGLRHLKVVVDAGNGMAGHTVGPALAGLDLELIGLYLELDGSFPHHQPNPLEPENLVDAQRAVREHSADLGLVFDGDADRCFLIDERGEVITPSVVTALIAANELAREPGATIVVNTVTSGTVEQVVTDLGGRVVTSLVGHTHVKALMAAEHAIFGGEHSAHYYFRDFWGADTGMLAALHVLAMLGRSDQPMSALVRDYQRVSNSGELNSTVADQAAVVDRVARAFADHGSIDRVDGLTVRGVDADERPWWFNVRASNTEPLLRLNVEAASDEVMVAIRDDVLDLIRPPETTQAKPTPASHIPDPDGA
ncbi:phosphomannomutase/phosphoglucomutase [Aestuariimicrobium soli]|uniref:phosphomannomutase/phosphoglucomutase n=1 Tax=Aestuariimicrobium soli TaxID=2035834 RepID=UPI003EC0CE07